MAPEMFNTAYNESVDIYALGMCVVEMFVKRVRHSSGCSVGVSRRGDHNSPVHAHTLCRARSPPSMKSGSCFGLQRRCVVARVCGRDMAWRVRWLTCAPFADCKIGPGASGSRHFEGHLAGRLRVRHSVHGGPGVQWDGTYCALARCYPIGWTARRRLHAWLVAMLTLPW